MKKQVNIVVMSIACMITSAAFSQQKFSGNFTNGYKGARLSFVLSAEKNAISDFTFTGYWRCGGRIENITAGPEKVFPVKNGEVHAVITDPDNGGSSAFRFNLNGIIKGKSASGTFRMSITGLSCDTYVLNWNAKSK